MVWNKTSVYYALKELGGLGIFKNNVGVKMVIMMMDLAEIVSLVKYKDVGYVIIKVFVLNVLIGIWILEIVFKYKVKKLAKA